MKQEDLNEILENHRLWLNRDKNGKRADLQHADLQGADLREADLLRADLE